MREERGEGGWGREGKNISGKYKIQAMRFKTDINESRGFGTGT